VHEKQQVQNKAMKNTTEGKSPLKNTTTDKSSLEENLRKLQIFFSLQRVKL